MTESGEPTRTLEVEITFDVDDTTPVPDWTALAEVATMSDVEVRHLDATYYDTAEANLAQVGVAIRRRTGGPDAGWHLKGPIIDGGRIELQWPDTGDDTIPEAVLDVASQWTTSELLPFANIVNERHAYQLRDARGDSIAEFVDDHVTGIDVRGDERREWREWEVELAPAAPTNRDDRNAFFAAITACAYDAGARPASSASKLARTLGH